MNVCRIVVLVFALIYLVALALFLIGTFGWFGQQTDPLSGVFLIPIGLPWNLLGNKLPEAYLPWLAALAPLVNLILLRALCRAVWRG